MSAGDVNGDAGRVLIAQGTALEAAPRTSVVLRERRRCAIVVDGKETRPRIAKTYELLAYLVTRPDGEAGRDELLKVLFEGRIDDSAGAYLRHARPLAVARDVLREPVVVDRLRR